ncbi:BglG family transcription antiterminator [Breznakia pachnodae]|uniref:Mannitol/fructose-specific phosphotransferase system IIA component (Ntr-type)/biotin operon repressor n=1 Tax=Breznakia pachnodae TaxID=265178 RepID=A0ABU0E1D0_9FIRM|nr:PTS sugar transporter subunit IIA [Breznakia pachnodae]MDQ0360531.1 mannitol/fructose-specific phosphotransferase system IIA component (Ntr-type)/biotin operon repressor [Breznakia pachnodae]
MFNDLSSRETEILKILFKANDYVKGEKIANQIGKSIKTIRNDINNIKTIAVDYNFHISSKANRGYKLIIENYDDFNEFISNYNDEINDYSVRKERMRFYELTFFLLVNENESTFEHLEEVFFFSKSVLRMELVSVKSILSHFYLSLHIEKEMIYIVGQEYHKRLLLTFLVNSKRYSKSIFEDTFDKELIDAEVSSFIDVMIKEVMKNNNVSLSREVLKILSIYLYFSNYRNNDNYFIEPISKRKMKLIEKYTEEIKLSKSILKVIELKFNYEFLQLDADIFTVLIISFCYPKRKNLYANDKELNEIADYIMEWMCVHTNESFFKDDLYMLGQVYAYLYSKRVRDAFKTYDFVLAPLKFKRKRTVTIELSYDLYSEMCKNFNFPFVEREVIFLSQCLSNWYAKINVTNSKYKIAVASKLGMVESNRVAEMLRVNYIQFNGSFEPIETYELETNSGDFDLVVTDYKQINVKDKPIYFADSYVQFNEIKYLIKFIRQSRNTSSEMKIIDNESIKNGLKLKTKEEVFKYVERLYRKLVSGKRKVYDNLTHREERFPYELGNRTALICIRDEYVNQSKMYFIILEKPIMWHVNYVNLVIVYVTNTKIENLRCLGGTLTLFLQDIEAINHFIAIPSLDKIEKYFNE